MKDQKISLYSLKYAESTLDEKYVFYNGQSGKNVPISFCIYIIKKAAKSILVDAGCDTMPGFVMKRYYSPAFVLRRLGVSAEDITDVIITHSHHDHIEGVKHFKNAVVHITEREYLIGKSYISEDISLNVFKDEYNIDPQIKIIEWGGHSAGSAIVEIKSRDVTHVIAGDECYVNDCITHKIPTGNYYNFDKCCEFVKKYSASKYDVHTCHDISLKTEKII